MSAVLYVCTRFHDYICGQKVTVETDRKPLAGIMAKPLHKLSPRIRSMRRKLLWYDINATRTHGNEMFVPDCLSRAPAKHAASIQELDVIVEVDNIIRQLPVSPEKLQTTQPTMMTYSYCKTQSRGDGLRKEAKYLKPFNHILHFAMKSCTAMACFFEEISL